MKYLMLFLMLISLWGCNEPTSPSSAPTFDLCVSVCNRYIYEARIVMEYNDVEYEQIICGPSYYTFENIPYSSSYNYAFADVYLKNAFGVWRHVDYGSERIYPDSLIFLTASDCGD